MHTRTRPLPQVVYEGSLEINPIWQELSPEPKNTSLNTEVSTVSSLKYIVF